MTVRAGMTHLIDELRRMIDSIESEYSSDLLQDYLDSYRQQRKRITLYPQSDYIDGTWRYTEYPFPAFDEWIEKSATDSGWALRDNSGASAPSHTINHAARLITFASDTDGDLFYLDYRAYDLNLTAAKIWKEKAAAVLQADWASDNHDIKASQEYRLCMNMAAYYESRSASGSAVMEIFRGDVGR
jgi:hypothetical protein